MIKHILIGCLSASTLLAAERIEPELTGMGTLNAIRIDGQRLALKTGIDVDGPQWKGGQGLSPWNVLGARLVSSTGRERTYTGTIPFAGAPVSFTQTVSTDEQGVRILAQVTPESAAKSEGIRLSVSLPIDSFAGGQARLLEPVGQQPAEATMPTQKPQKQHFLTGEAAGVELRNGARVVTLRFDRPRHVSVQDNRVFNAENYSVYFMLHSGDLVAGQTSAAEVHISANDEIDRSGVTLDVKPQEEQFDFVGLGGNFVYATASPTPAYNLEHLNVAWGRVWMPLHQWETDNDNADPASTDVAALAANDKPGTDLRRSLEMARELEKRNIPCIASIWGIPRWMQSNPGEPGKSEHGKIIAREFWDEMAESIGSYLLYAKDKYGVEPEMFSFNEPDYGVTVKITPEEHRDMVKLLGRHFQKLGLKTRLLGGDVAHARGSASYVAPLMDDPEAMSFIDAISFHSWGGASPEQYGQWHAAAEKAGKPLMVTEAGVDAGAWRHPGVFKSYWLGHAEARQYIELLQHARPQVILLWEYSDDYGLLDVDRSTNPPTVSPTKRFHFMQQLATLTPRNGKGVACTSTRPDVLIAAVKGPDGKLTLHIANDGAARPASLPRLGGPYAAYITDSSRDMVGIGEVSGTMELPAWSLVTLVQK